MSLPSAYHATRSVVILGMGGSAISGDLARTLGSTTASVPIEVVRGYSIPGYVDSHTLVIAISFSGNTEETLAAFEAASRKGASLLVIAGGGELHERARAIGIPALSYTKCQPAPRRTAASLHARNPCPGYAGCNPMRRRGNHERH